MYEEMSVQELCEKLNADRDEGLTRQEAAGRYRSNGPNKLKEKRKKTPVEAFFAQLNDPLIYVLIAAAGVSVFLQEISDAVIIGVVVMLNAVVGMIQEGKAIRALESLKKLVSPKALVIREGKSLEIPAAELVVGDLVCLEAGCLVPADMRLVEASKLQAEESALTGESMPVRKDADILCQPGVPLGDRRNMVYMSTMITGGRGQGIVTATGMETEIGHIAAMINESKEELTPLQKKLGELGMVLSILSLLLCGVLFLMAALQRRNLFEMLLTAISLAVAAVPEGLPAVVTICLALSVTRMVRAGTIVRRLPAVETLGAVSVVCSDKTGTLTMNRMTVESCFVDQKQTDCRYLQETGHEDFLRGMLLCNDALVEGEERIGDPTELALAELAGSFGLYRQELEKRFPRREELPFDSDRKMMTTYHRASGSRVGVSYTKGAPDEVIKRCSRICLYGKIVTLTESMRRELKGGIEAMAGEALRTLAVAMRTGDGPEEKGMILLGIAGMRDPARPEAAEAVATFKQAGVETVMITGDHVDTAFSIGRQLGIVQRKEQCMTGEELQRLPESMLPGRLRDIRVFARVAPAQKVQIVRGFQADGRIVAMTGDGVNDAPSLKAADIGIAMGRTGTDVAKQAADMILTDDNFATIERAIEEGRGVYENIRKSVIFLLSSNLGEILTMFCAVLLGLASPLKSSHILWINLITDSLPALALGVDKNDTRALMLNPPRKAKESLFARGGLACTCFYGVLIAAISLGAFLLLPYRELVHSGMPLTLENLRRILGQEQILRRAQTYAFTVLGMSQLFHAVGMRDTNRSIFRMNHLENKLMITACLVGVSLQVLVTEVPILIGAFTTVHLEWQEWLRLAGLAAFPLFAHEFIAILQPHPQRPSSGRMTDKSSQSGDSVL